MSLLPKVAIVGRPNVGKSALFNRICKKRLAIVHEVEGITRDRLYAEADFFGLPFVIIDTGGIDPQSEGEFNDEIRRQASIAIEEADSVILVVDSQVGPTTLDEEVSKLLLHAKKRVCLAVNKVDDSRQEYLLHEFHGLGISKMICVSAEHNVNVAELVGTALEGFSPIEEAALPGLKIPKVAIVGRPNVGKSTLVNILLSEPRCIVSPTPGTTRDSIDVQIEYEGRPYTLIDTAGIRRKHSEKEPVDKFAAMRTERAIERADVCVLMLDSQQGLTTQEKRIATSIEEAGKSCVLFFNKWDLVKGFRMEHCQKAVRDSSCFLEHCPMLFGSAKSGRNLDKLWASIDAVYNASQQRIPTAQLNQFVATCIEKQSPPMLQGGKRLRIYYMTQISTCPPEFLLFVNRSVLMADSYKKFLLNQFRETYGFEGTPLRLYLRGKLRQADRVRPSPSTHAMTVQAVESEEGEDLESALLYSLEDEELFVPSVEDSSST